MFCEINKVHKVAKFSQISEDINTSFLNTNHNDANIFAILFQDELLLERTCTFPVLVTTDGHVINQSPAKTFGERSG